MKIINENVFVHSLTINNRQAVIPKSYYHKIVYIESEIVEIDSYGKTFTAEKNDYLVLEDSAFIKIKGKNNGEAIVNIIYLLPEYIKRLSNKECNLEICFIEAKDTGKRLVRASSEVYMILKSLAVRLICYENLQGFGREEILESTIVLFLSFANRGYIDSKLNKKRIHNKLDIIDDIFIYINRHISEDITLDDLEKEFYMSKFYLSKVFKEATDMTIHSCILKRKLSHSKKLIEQNMPIVEVYSKCGFGGYSHFFRAFKKEFGITPKQYYKEAIKNIEKSSLYNE